MKLKLSSCVQLEQDGNIPSLGNGVIKICRMCQDVVNEDAHQEIPFRRWLLHNMRNHVPTYGMAYDKEYYEDMNQKIPTRPETSQYLDVTSGDTIKNRTENGII